MSSSVHVNNYFGRYIPSMLLVCMFTFLDAYVRISSKKVCKYWYDVLNSEKFRNNWYH